MFRHVKRLITTLSASWAGRPMCTDGLHVWGGFSGPLRTSVIGQWAQSHPRTHAHKRTHIYTYSRVVKLSCPAYFDLDLDWVLVNVRLLSGSWSFARNTYSVDIGYVSARKRSLFFLLAYTFCLIAQPLTFADYWYTCMQGAHWCPHVQPHARPGHLNFEHFGSCVRDKRRNQVTWSNHLSPTHQTCRFPALTWRKSQILAAWENVAILQSANKMPRSLLLMNLTFRIIFFSPFTIEIPLRVVGYSFLFGWLYRSTCHRSSLPVCIYGYGNMQESSRNFITTSPNMTWIAHKSHKCSANATNWQ